jgi:hypothetical protein
MVKATKICSLLERSISCGGTSTDTALGGTLGIWLEVISQWPNTVTGIMSGRRGITILTPQCGRKVRGAGKRRTKSY